jgi:tetratricopeptide (TPR) repeat protein
VVFLGGCAQRGGQSDGNIPNTALKNSARAILAGRSFDNALLALRRDDDGALLRSVEGLRRSGIPSAPSVAAALTVAAVQDADDTRRFFHSLTRDASREKSAMWQGYADEHERRHRELTLSVQAEDKESLNALGYMLADKGKTPEDFRRAAELTRRSLQKWDETLKSIPEGDPQLPRLRFNRALLAHDSYAWALYKQKRFDEALREQSEAVATAKKNVEAVSLPERLGLADMLYHLGKIQQAVGQKAQARKSFEEALTYHPNHEDTKQELKKG